MNLGINTNLIENDLDAILKNRYGNGISDFDMSFRLIQEYYWIKTHPEICKSIDARIELLNKIKISIVENIDDYLAKINFYDLCRPKSFRWSTDRKQAFIIKSHCLDKLISLVNQQIELYEKFKLIFSSRKQASFNIDVSRISRLKAIRLLVLAWVPVFKRKTKIDWQNLELLLKWYAINKISLLNKIGIELNNIPSAASLRTNWHKSIKPELRFVASIMFRLCFSKFDKLSEQDRNILNTRDWPPEQYIKQWIQSVDLSIIESILRFEY